MDANMDSFRARDMVSYLTEGGYLGDGVYQLDAEAITFNGELGLFAVVKVIVIVNTYQPGPE